MFNETQFIFKTEIKQQNRNSQDLIKVYNHETKSAKTGKRKHITITATYYY